MRIILLLLASFSFFISASQKADMILVNGKIFTGESRDKFVEAIAVKGEKIIATGNSSDIKKHASPQTKVIELSGRTVIPGINDAHYHVTVKYPSYDFSFFQTPTDRISWTRVKDSIINIVQRVPKGLLLRAEIGEEILDDTTVRRKLLDSLAPNNPVILFPWHGHGYICNSAGLELLGLNNESDFLGGHVGRYPDSSLNGLLTEYAGFRVSAILASKMPYEEIEKQVKEFYQSATLFGITSMQVMATSLPEETFTRLYSNNDFGTRNRIISFPQTNKNHVPFPQWSGIKKLNKKNYASGIKLIVDGTPIERLASITMEYNDDPGNFGEPNFSEDVIRKYVETCIRLNQQLVVHTSGDSAIKTILRNLRYENSADYWKKKRPRLEHADLAIMNESDFETISKLGVVIVPNPLHFATPQLMAERFGNRTKYLQALKSLIENDIPIAFGSDGPFNPYLNIMFAVIHPTNPAEGISVADAVMAYTSGSAYAEGRENEKGKLVKGQLADLAVLSQDIFSIPVNDLPKTISTLTVVGGKVVHEVTQVR